MTKAHRQLTRFLVIGATAAAIDFAFYRFLIWFGVEFDIAKACSFTIGALFAYAANKAWTFKRKKHGLAPLTFTLLYGGTLFVNTFTNGLIVRLLPPAAWTLAIAFVIATGVSATLNFIGMKWIVFRKGAM